MRLAIALDYRNVDALNYYLQQNQLVILNTDYGVQVTQTIAVSAAELAAVQTAITNLLSGQVTFTEQGEQFAEVPVSQD